MAKAIVLLFGEMGSGKSYLGKQLAKDRGLRFVEGDDLLTEPIKNRAGRFLPLSKDMVQDFVHKLSADVHELLQDVSINGLVVSQALYLNEHREQLIEFWASCGYEVETVWVKTGFFQNLKQLWRRPKGIRWIAYWLLNKPAFEKPRHPAFVIHNKSYKLKGTLR